MTDKESKANESSAPRPEQDKFCFYPFMQMLLQPTGAISPCCWNQELVLGEIQKSSLKEIWNDEPIRKLRREFLEGKPIACAQQMRHIGCHHFSRRDFQDKILVAENLPGGPLRLDVRLNGKCNLKCVMCEVWKQPNGTYDASDFWQKGPTEIFPHLLEMDVLGGEPFVQQDTYRLIDQITAINPQCTWAFVTNGHYHFNDAIRSRLEKIRIRWMQVSLDSLNPETYPKIRVGGTLERTLATIEALNFYRQERKWQKRPFRFIVSMCVQQLNWREVAEFIDFADERRIEPVLQFAYQPDRTSLLYLAEEERQQIAEYFLKLRYIYGDGKVNSILLPVLDSLSRPQRESEQKPTL